MEVNMLENSILNEELINNHNYCIVTVIEGKINVENNIINKGESFVVTSLSNKILLENLMIKITIYNWKNIAFKGILYL